jgi:hypothetical protein
MSIVETMGKDERYDLLYAVVWPESEELKREAA